MLKSLIFRIETLNLVLVVIRFGSYIVNEKAWLGLEGPERQKGACVDVDLLIRLMMGRDRYVNSASTISDRTLMGFAPHVEDHMTIVLLNTKSYPRMSMYNLVCGVLKCETNVQNSPHGALILGTKRKLRKKLGSMQNVDSGRHKSERLKHKTGSILQDFESFKRILSTWWD